MLKYYLEMPRTSPKPTQRGSTSIAVMKRAARMVLEDQTSLREAARLFGLPSYASLHRFVQKIRNGQTATVGYNPTTRVFSNEQEAVLENYVINAANRYYGIGLLGLRKLAYQMCVKHIIKHPVQWDAGIFFIRLPFLDSV